MGSKGHDEMGVSSGRRDVGRTFAQNKIDKADILKITREDCPTQFIKNKQFIDLPLIGGGTLPGFCECFAVRIASQLHDADYGNA